MPFMFVQPERHNGAKVYSTNEFSAQQQVVPSVTGRSSQIIRNCNQNQHRRQNHLIRFIALLHRRCRRSSGLQWHNDHHLLDFIIYVHVTYGYRARRLSVVPRKIPKRSGTTAPSTMTYDARLPGYHAAPCPITGYKIAKDIECIKI